MINSEIMFLDEKGNLNYARELIGCLVKKCEAGTMGMFITICFLYLENKKNVSLKEIEEVTNLEEIKDLKAFLNQLVDKGLLITHGELYEPNLMQLD